MFKVKVLRRKKLISTVGAGQVDDATDGEVTV